MFKRLKAKLDTIFYNDPNRGRTNQLYQRQSVSDWAHYVHKAKPILMRAFEIQDVMSREIMSFYHPFQHANIYKVSEACASDPIRLIDPKLIDDENPEPKKQLQNHWDRNQGAFLLKKSMEKGRKHGWILYVPVNKEKLPPYYSGPPWHVYSADEAQCTNWDTFGHPFTWKITPSNKYIESFDISANQCVFFDVYLTDDFDGFPEGSSIWDDLVDYLFIKDAGNAFFQRMGNGFMVLPVPAGTSAEAKSAYQDKMSHVRTEMGLVWEVDNDMPNAKPEWLTPQANAGYTDYLNSLEDGIATGMGFPKRWLKGDSEGAMESSGKDKMQVNSKLNAIFKQWERYILQVCLFHGWIQSFEDAVALPGFKMEISDQELAAINQIKATTIVSKTFLTINEQRAEDGYPPIDGGDGFLPPGLDGSGEEGSTNEDEQGQTEDGAIAEKADAIDLTQFSDRELAKIMGCSPSTANRRKKAWLEPHMHPFSTDLKFDSVQLQPDLWESHGYLITAGELKYPDSDLPDLRPLDEIRNWWLDATPKEVFIGVTNKDNHESKIPGEILREEAVGTFKAEKLDEKGVWGTYLINTKKVEERLGPQNWLTESLKQNQPIPTSVGLWSVDKPTPTHRINTNLDVRSAVFTRHPRNSETKAI